MSVTWTWNITKDLFHSGVSVWLCRKSLSPRFARGISGGWIALCILGVRTWRKYSEAINHLSCPSKNTLFCEGHNCVSFRVKIMVSADLGGWGTREGFPPAPSFPLLFSPPYDFPLLPPLERSKWNLGSFFCPFQLILTKNPFSWSFLTQQRQIAWSSFHPRQSQLPWAQLQTIIPQFSVKMKQTAS